LFGGFCRGTGQIGSNDYGWTIPLTLPDNTYYILARLTDGVGTDLRVYASGSIRIAVGAAATRELSQVGLVFAGAIFDGAVPGGRMGEVMTGGKDFSRDGYPDFLLVAPQAFTTWKPVPTGRDNNGEAYLIYSSGLSGRWPQGQPISIGTIGAFNNLEGVTFVGPSYSTTSSGIREALMMDDRDGDGWPEIVFGIPDVDRILTDHQDYDPLDSNTIHNDDPPLQPGAVAGRYYYQAEGWQEYSTQSPANGHPADDLRQPSGANPGKRSGMIIYVSSRSAINNQVTRLDETGQVSIWARQGNARSIGMRLYPRPSSDMSDWGDGMAVSDLFASPVFPALLVARPEAANGTGSVKILLQSSMDPEFKAWTGAPAFGWNTEPIAWTLPAADSDGAADEDRRPEWPNQFWYDFMDPFDRTGNPQPPAPFGWPAPQHIPNPTNFDIMNSDAAVAAGGHLGRPTNLRDFNRDTLEDVAVASPDASPDGLAGAGTAYIVYGSRNLRGIDVSRFRQNDVPGFELAGNQPGEQLGWRMGGPGDLNGDLYNDWLVTAPNRDWSGRVNCGAVAIIYGRQKLYGKNTIENVPSDLQGAIIYGGSDDDRLGMYLATVGDVDRDGYPDFVVSAPGYDAPEDLNATPPRPARQNCGAVYLIYGGPHLKGEFDIRSLGSVQLPGKVYVGPEADAAVGPVAAAGDTDQDYYQDFLIAYPGYSPSDSEVEAGRAWLIYGSRKQAR
jgi:hypothetical protein